MRRILLLLCAAMLLPGCATKLHEDRGVMRGPPVAFTPVTVSCTTEITDIAGARDTCSRFACIDGEPGNMIIDLNSLNAYRTDKGQFTEEPMCLISVDKMINPSNGLKMSSPMRACITAVATSPGGTIGVGQRGRTDCALEGTWFEIGISK